MKTSLRLSIIAAAGLLAVAATASAQTSTSGAVQGVIKDKATGKPVAGATVVATSPALQGTQAQITDSSGAYILPNLPPGMYEITVYYADAKFTRTNVLVQLGKTAEVVIGINTKASKGEVITIKGEAPVIDEGSTKTGVTITSDYTQNVPTGRTFGAVLGAAAGSQGDDYGVSIGGSTSPENEYIVDGVDTTDPAFGLQSTDLPNEFVKETEVITGGYNAEYGRSTGGIVNVITKTGSNHFHGSLFAYFTPGQLVASADSVPQAGNAIARADNLGYSADVGGEVGGPIVKDKLWFHVGFNPSFSGTNVDRSLQTQVDKVNNTTGAMGGDGIPDVDKNGFAILKAIPNTTHTYQENARTYFFTGNLTGAVNQNNQGQLTVSGSPGTSKNYLTVVGPASAGLLNETRNVLDLSGKWTSKFNNNATQIDVVGGFHQGNSDQFNPNDNNKSLGTGGYNQVRYDGARPLTDFSTIEQGIDPGGVPAACQDGGSNDPYPKITNCPVTFYHLGGLGFLQNRDTSRAVGTVSITERVKALGHHTFKAGADIEDQHYNMQEQYSGGTFAEELGNTLWELRHFYTPGKATGMVTSNPGDPAVHCGADLTGPMGMPDGIGDATCVRKKILAANGHTQNLSAYIQDSWSILPNLTLDAGVRWEQQTLFTASQIKGQVSPTTGQPIPNKAFTLGNNYAPRIGLIYDPTQEGRSKIFAHWGRFYESIPMDINARSYGGEALNIDFLAPGACPDKASMAIGSNGQANCMENANTSLADYYFGGGESLVAPGLGAQYMDEYVVGGEYELLPDFKVGATFSHRSLGRVIEDVSPDGGNTYIIANPGTISKSGIAAVQAQAKALMASDPARAAFLSQMATNYANIANFDKPVRNYNALVLTAEKRFTHHFMVKASYTLSNLKGNYPGLFSPETGQLDPNITSEYDLPELMANRYGNLAADRPSNFKLDGYYQDALKSIGMFTIGASVRVASGIPINYLGSSVSYGLGESYILPRGTAGRTSLLWNADTHIAYGHKIGKGMLLQGFVDVFNLFNQQIQESVDQNYTFDAVNPIVGGTKADLAHAKVIDQSTGLVTNQVISKQPNYGNSTSLAAPLSVRFGLRLTF